MKSSKFVEFTLMFVLSIMFSVGEERLGGVLRPGHGGGGLGP